MSYVSCSGKIPKPKKRNERGLGSNLQLCQSAVEKKYVNAMDYLENFCSPNF